MNTKYFLLWLEAPMQSWGHDSLFGRRDTLKFPTKSGVLGLVLSAMGASGTQIDLLKDLNKYKHTVLSYKKNQMKENKEERNKTLLLRDFHMIGNGYDENDPWLSLNIPKTIEEKKPVGTVSKITVRYYLQDSYFAVIFGCNLEISDQISNALQQPAYSIYLGRKNCVPTDFVYRGVFDSEELAIQEANKISLEKNLSIEFSVREGVWQDSNVITLNDVPLQFGENKKYSTRQVSIKNEV